MDKSNKPRRALCVLRDPESGRELRINPLLFDMVSRIQQEAIACTSELHFNEGKMVSYHIRIDGERWTRGART
jgi:hypothetical protein